jgi:membrane-bound metal-dependent hydrolase YbcI (DUF457 family)
MVLGHFTVTAAGRDILLRRGVSLEGISAPWLFVGAYLPDIVDKPLNGLTGLSGRGYGHSLVVQVVVFGIAWLLARGLRREIASLALGAALHLLEDAVRLQVLLAPLLGTVPHAPEWRFFDSFLYFYKSGGPLVWIEVLALAYWAFRLPSLVRPRLERPVETAG